MRQRLAAIVLVLAPNASAVAATDLAALFACADRDALAAPAGVLEEELRAASGLACRGRQLPRGIELDCDAAKPLSIAGLPSREVGVSRDTDGTRRTRAVFRASPQRVREALAARQALRFEATDADRWTATHPGDPRWRVEIMGREDGSTLLVCVLEPARDEAADLALGIDRERGGIAGRVDFPAGTDLRLRVCAVPRMATLRARCVDLPPGRDDFLVAGLAPGDYDVVAFAIEGDPNRIVAAHAVPLEDCLPDQTGCASGLLVAVAVRAGSVVTDVDADRRFTTLPARFDEVLPRR